MKSSLAIFLDSIRERLESPGLHLAYRSAIVLDHGLEHIGQCLDLLRGNVLAGQKYVFVQCHGRLPFLVCDGRQASSKSLERSSIKSSRAETRLLTADFAVPRRSAAAVKLPASTTATNAASSSNRCIIVANYRTILCIRACFSLIPQQSCFRQR